MPARSVELALGSAAHQLLNLALLGATRIVAWLLGIFLLTLLSRSALVCLSFNPAP
jgi:hypothetical protein